MKKRTILITGANGQIGTVLARCLREKYGADAVLATDLRPAVIPEEGPFELLDACDADRLKTLIMRYDITEIYHLAAILSARGEQNPQEAWQINMTALLNVLELSRKFNLKVFFPSSIAVFGNSTPRHKTPQFPPMDPTTVYGISKVAGEQWCNYYYEKYQVDVRSIRYPGIIGYQSLPGGGTTDYAVEIYHAAVKGENYVCFLNAGTRLPMMYMDDAIQATLQIMDAPIDQINIRTSYNIAAMSFTPEEIAASIQQVFPDFKVSYAPDFRQQIAASWVESIDDSHARADWQWKARFDLSAMTAEMLKKLQANYPQTTI